MSNYFITNKDKEPISISDDEYARIFFESSLLFRYKGLIISWLTYHEAFELLKDFKKNDIVNLLDKFDLRNFAFPNVYVGNVLNAFYMFVEYCEHYFDCFKNGIKKNVYDNNFSYRYVYNLRNYSTHNEMPILKISAKYDMIKKKYFDIGFTASKEKFCNAKKLQTKVQEEAKNYFKEDDVDVYKYLKEVDVLLFQVVLKIFKNDSKKIIDIYKNWYSYESIDDADTNLYLWNKSNVEIYMTLNLYMTYMHLKKHLLNNTYYKRHPVSDDATSIRNLCSELKTILHIKKEE